MTRRRWIAETWDDATAIIAGANADHLARVLRAQPGMKADVIAGGRLFAAEVAEVIHAAGKSEVRFNLLEELNADRALSITLVLAIFKFDRMEWVIEKATELGVRDIAPVVARRTEKHLAQSAEKRVDRWRRIAHESSQQARRTDIPDIHDPASLSSRIQSTSHAIRIVLAEQEQTTTLRQAIDEAIRNSPAETPAIEVAIGPEGGWAPEEEALFHTNGWRAVTLGPRILRAETAAISALAVVASCLE